MRIDRMTLAHARRALREARPHLYDPNVTLIDFGHGQVAGQSVEEKLAIRFHVRRKFSPLALETAVEAGRTVEVPGSIGGFPTDVIQATFRPHRIWWSTGGRPRTQTSTGRTGRAGRSNPMQGGISISDERHNAYGTLGGLVEDRETGARMILSNWHVLVGEWNARVGQRIYQPGRLDGGTSADTVATLSRHAMAADLDAAVAALNGSRDLTPEQLDLGPVRGVARAELGLEVIKSGRASKVTSGVVRGIEGYANLTYASIRRVIRKVVTIEPSSARQEVSAPGDSGSWWLDPTTMRAIGLHFAGSNSPETGLALDMQEVLDQLGVDIVRGT